MKWTDILAFIAMPLVYFTSFVSVCVILLDVKMAQQVKVGVILITWDFPMLKSSEIITMLGPILLRLKLMYFNFQKGTVLKPIF